MEKKKKERNDFKQSTSRIKPEEQYEKLLDKYGGDRKELVGKSWLLPTGQVIQPDNARGNGGKYAWHDNWVEGIGCHDCIKIRADTTTDNDPNGDLAHLHISDVYDILSEEQLGMVLKHIKKWNLDSDDIQIDGSANSEVSKQIKDALSPEFDRNRSEFAQRIAQRNKMGEAFQELEHPRDGDGKFADKDGGDSIKNVRVNINKSILQGQIYYLLSNFEEESQDYKPFQKVSDEDRSIRYNNQKVREEIELLKDEINSPELEGLPVIKEEPNTHEVKVFKNGFALDNGEKLLSYKDVVGFKSNTTDITIDNFTDDSRFGLTEKQAEKQIETIRLVWNQLPDKLRDTVKHFKIERTPELMHDPDDETKWLNEHDTMVAGSWMPYKLSDGKPNNVTEAGTLTIRIDSRRTSNEIKGTLTHECGHVRYHNIKDSNPEKIKEWEKVAKGSPPTSYSKYHKDRWIKATKSVEKQSKRNFSATQSVEIDGEWTEVPWIEMYGDDYIAMTVEERKHMLESNEKIREELYYNELHSEVHMYMMNRTDKKLKSKTGKITKNMDRFVNAYKELHGL